MLHEYEIDEETRMIRGEKSFCGAQIMDIDW